MRTDKKLFERIIYLLTAVLFVSACSTFANTAVYDLSGDLDIWQITGTICNDYSTGCDLTYTLTQDSAGKITGGGNVINCNIDEFNINGSYTITGTITQKKGVATVKMKIKISVLGDDGYGVYRWRGTETITATIDSSTIYGTAKFDGGTFDYTQNLPDDMDGSAELSINFSATKGTKLGGTGILTLSNGDFYDYIIKGSYNAKKVLDSLTLTGVKVDGKSPGNFTLAIDHNNYNLKSLKGKSLGQTLAASNIPAE